MRRAICAYGLTVICSEDILSLELIVERFEVVPRHCGNGIVRKLNLANVDCQKNLATDKIRHEEQVSVASEKKVMVMQENSCRRLYQK